MCAAAGCLTLAPLLLISRAAGTRSSGPPLLDILRGEIDREFPILKAKGDPGPYYLAYEVTADRTVSITASRGALVTSAENEQRGFDTTVRVGTPAFDNYHPYQGTRPQFTNFVLLTLQDDPNQIRRALWSETDNVDRAAAQRLIQLRTDQQLIAQSKDRDADFSVEPAVHSVTQPETYPVDVAAWNQKVRSWSSVFTSHESVLASNVSFQVQHETRTFADSEGSAIQQGSNLFRVAITAEGLAPDGMAVGTFQSFEATDPAHMPSGQTIQTRANDVASTVDRLVKAPPAEPIVAPAILSGRAAAVYFHEILGHAIEGHRQKDVGDGQTFSKMIGQKILPDFITVRFDPTMRQFQGHDLIGGYEYDDEGVKARPVTAVENGVLKTFLLSRSPVGEFKESNGHGRRQPGHEVVSRQSNLIVQAAHPVSDLDLRGELVEQIKQQKKPYGLYFQEVSSGYTTTGRKGVQAFTVVPLVVYRVYADGRPDELIRGVDIVGTRLASLQKIIAASDDYEVFNGFCGAESGSIPVSAVSPAMLFSEIEIQKKPNAQARLPILPRPEAQK